MESVASIWAVWRVSGVGVGFWREIVFWPGERIRCWDMERRAWDAYCVDRDVIGSGLAVALFDFA